MKTLAHTHWHELPAEQAAAWLESDPGAFGLFAWEHGIEGTNVEEARSAVVELEKWLCFHTRQPARTS